MPADFAVIFDVDGVLIDSYTPHFESWKRLAAEHGRTYTEEQFVAGFGRTSREVLLDQWTGETLTDARIAELADRKEQLYRDVVEEDFIPIAGAGELIRALYNAGVPVAVGSSGPPDNVDLVIRKLNAGALIQAKVTGYDVTRGKPDPQVFLLAAERIGMPPARCVVLEDTTFGLRAAQAAGMKCVGVLSTGHKPEELVGADLVVDSLREIDVERLRRLFESRGSAH